MKSPGNPLNISTISRQPFCSLYYCIIVLLSYHINAPSQLRASRVVNMKLFIRNLQKFSINQPSFIFKTCSYVLTYLRNFYCSDLNGKSIGGKAWNNIIKIDRSSPSPLNVVGGICFLWWRKEKRGGVAPIIPHVGNLSHINLTPNFHTCSSTC